MFLGFFLIAFYTLSMLSSIEMLIADAVGLCVWMENAAAGYWEERERQKKHEPGGKWGGDRRQGTFEQARERKTQTTDTRAMRTPESTAMVSHISVRVWISGTGWHIDCNIINEFNIPWDYDPFV